MNQSTVSITRDTLNGYLELKYNLEEKAIEILMLKCKLEDSSLKGQGYVGDIEYIDFGAEEIGIKTIKSFSCSCCRDEMHWYSFPTYYLFADNWIKEVKERVENERLEDQRKKQDVENKAKIKREEAERKEFERLRAKFGERGNEK